MGAGVVVVGAGVAGVELAVVVDGAGMGVAGFVSSGIWRKKVKQPHVTQPFLFFLPPNGQYVFSFVFCPAHWLLGRVPVLSTRKLSLWNSLPERTSCEPPEWLWQFSPLPSLLSSLSNTFASDQSWSNNNNTTTNVQSPTKAPIALFTSVQSLSCLFQSTLTMLIDSQDSLKSDLTLDKPIWPLSTFGPAKFEPNLVSNLDESMEELRVRAVIALKAGNVNEYVEFFVRFTPSFFLTWFLDHL